MRKFLVILLLSVVAAPGCIASNHNYMWFDCEANYATLSSPDSIKFYLEKVKSLGFDNVVVDVKSIMGEVLYDSKIAPYMSPFDGVERPRDYDMMGHFITYGHSLGLKVFASLNIFCGGHNYMDRGIIYNEHPEFQAICYEKGKFIPISEIKTNYNGMLNPSNPEVQEYELSILKEFVTKYPLCDGLIFDRLRYDGKTSDFSDLSRRQFEEFIGHKVKNYPKDILHDSGNLLSQWYLWRATVIHDFVKKTHDELKAINPNLIIGDYTGAWYPTYYELGVNWASKKFDPSRIMKWAPPEYQQTGYADLLDVYMTGLYYSYITMDDIDKAVGIKGRNNEAGLQLALDHCYSVEGGAALAKEVTCGVVPVVGSIYVEQYLGEMEKFPQAVEQSLKSTGGVMIFDIVHLCKHSLWDELETAMRNQKQIK